MRLNKNLISKLLNHMQIPPGKARFLYFLNQVQIILKKAEESQSPALLIYNENMRTPLFMLEALTRLYKKMQDKKKFKKLNVRFKEIEDLLGEIDFYDGFHKEFTEYKNMPKPITDHLKNKMDEKAKALNHVLKKEKWIGKHNKRIEKIFKKLDKIDWPDEEEDAMDLLSIYRYYINKINENYKNNLIFKDIEADVHELRRELRWLSIYPQALLGLIQFKEDNELPDFLNKYLTSEIVNSPYNLMPEPGASQHLILINKNYFYALSWMIDALGTLKDSGLTIMALEQSLRSVYNISSGTEQLAYSICNDSQMKIPEILNQSQQLAKTFFEENILENLISDSE